MLGMFAEAAVCRLYKNDICRLKSRASLGWKNVEGKRDGLPRIINMDLIQPIVVEKCGMHSFIKFENPQHEQPQLELFFSRLYIVAVLICPNLPSD